MLCGVDAGGEARFIIAGFDGNGLLSQHRAGIDVFNHFMHGAAGLADAGSEGLADGMHATEGR